MSTQYNGIPDNLNSAVPAATLNIASSTNTTPIVITTSTAHGLHSGDEVLVYGHQTNTNANGRWDVTALTSTTFSLNGSTPTAIGGATGLVQPLTLGPTYPIPADGDDFNANAFNGAYESLGDRTAFLLEYAFPVVEWGSIKRSPHKVTDRNSATPLHANPGIANQFQIATQTLGFTVVLDIASYPPLDGEVMEFILDAQTQTLNFFNEGGSDGAVVQTGGWLKFRFDKSLGFWKVIGAATIDPMKMLFANPF